MWHFTVAKYNYSWGWVGVAEAMWSLEKLETMLNSASVEVEVEAELGNKKIRNTNKKIN